LVRRIFIAKSSKMRGAFWILLGLIIVPLVVMAAALGFDAPRAPPPLASVFKPFADVDFSDLPVVQTYAARDGVKLGYRAYEGTGSKTVVLIHGSSDDGTGTHLLAKALRDTGASVYVPVLRGHHNSGRSGDIDYIGQLEDDLADFVEVFRPLRTDSRFTLIGFSAGGGFVLRVMGSPKETLFDCFVMISPGLPLGAPTLRPGIGGWVSLAMPRIITLAILNLLGIDWFNGLSVVAFATTPEAPNLTGHYSFRLAVDFGAPRDYLAALGRSKKPAALLVGSNDELFYADRFEPLIAPVRPDLRMTIVPGADHVGLMVTSSGIASVRKSFLDCVSQAPQR
jgi:non-heme chloroperoxidase